MGDNKRLRIIGYVVFGIFAFGLSFYMTFPADAVGQRLTREFNRMTNGKYSVTFSDMSLYRFTGVAAENVTVKSTASDGEPLEVTFDQVRARLEILPLFALSLGGNAEIEMGEGTVELDVGTGSEKGSFDVELEIEELDFASPPILPKMAGMPLAGKLSGKAQVSWSAELRKSEGKASVTIRDAAMGPGAVQGFSFPTLGLGQLDLALDLRAGRLRLASFQQKGGDLNARANASTALNRSFGNSSLDACFEIKATDDFLSKNPKFKTVMELAQVKLKKDGEGYLHVPLSGTFKRPRQRGGLCKKGGTASPRER